MSLVNLRGLDRVQVLRELLENSRIQHDIPDDGIWWIKDGRPAETRHKYGMGRLPSMDELQKLIDGLTERKNGWIENVCQRKIHMDLLADEADTSDYDLYNGRETGRLLIERLRVMQDDLLQTYSPITDRDVVAITKLDTSLARDLQEIVDDLQDQVKGFLPTSQLMLMLTTDVPGVDWKEVQELPVIVDMMNKVEGARSLFGELKKMTDKRKEVKGRLDEIARYRQFQLLADLIVRQRIAMERKPTSDMEKRERVISGVEFDHKRMSMEVTAVEDAIKSNSLVASLRDALGEALKTMKARQALWQKTVEVCRQSK
jgi:hypothetical protein